MSPDRFRLALIVLLVLCAIVAAIATRYEVHNEGRSLVVVFDRWTGEAEAKRVVYPERRQ